MDHTTQLCGLHANCRQRVSTAWAGDTDKKNYDQKPLPVSPKQKYMAASKDLVLRVFGERVFRNGYRLKQNTFIQSSTKQVCFNLVGYLYMGPGVAQWLRHRVVGRSRERIAVASVTGIFLVDTDRTWGQLSL